MLRLWGKKLATIALAPEGMALRPAGAAAGAVRLLTSQTAPRSWETLLAELSGMGAELDVRRVRFILSSQFVRYAVLPWQAGILSGQDWQALAEHQMRKLFGNAAEAWEVRVALQGYGESAVVCAIDRALLSRLQEIATQFRWAVHGIEPALMAVFNGHCRNLPATDCWLLLAEPQRLLLAEITDGKWQRFSVAAPPAGQEREECAGMMERAMRTDPGTKPAAVAGFGPSALLPTSLPSGVRLTYLPQPAANAGTTSLMMLASL